MAQFDAIRNWHENGAHIQRDHLQKKTSTINIIRPFYELIRFEMDIYR